MYKNIITIIYHDSINKYILLILKNQFLFSSVTSIFNFIGTTLTSCDISCVVFSLQQAVKDLAKIKETEEKIRRAKEAQEKREREKKEKAARKKALVDITAGTLDSLHLSLLLSMSWYSYDMISTVFVHNSHCYKRAQNGRGWPFCPVLERLPPAVYRNHY